MRRSAPGFTLIEVMLAVAVFAFAVVGFGVALNDVLGINSEILRTVQRRQAIESAAAQILAVSNNLVPSQGWTEIPGWGSKETWILQQNIQLTEPVALAGPNNTVITLQDWWRVDLRAVDAKGRPVDQIGILLWGQR